MLNSSSNHPNPSEKNLKWFLGVIKYPRTIKIVLKFLYEIVKNIFWQKWTFVHLFATTVNYSPLISLPMCIIPSVARPKADPVQGRMEAWRSGSTTCVQSARVLGRQKWRKNFEDHDDDGRSKMTRSHMGIPPNFSFFVFKILSNFLH